jgi:glycerophosphoryl diester phosphodiesterase
MKRAINPYPLLIAHRGNSGPAPENTAQAINQAIALGVDMVELEVSLSRDGLPVLIHGPGLERSTDGKGPVSGSDLAYLKTLDAGSWKGVQFAGAPILTLMEGLELVCGRALLNLDLKTPAAVQPTISALREMDMTDQVIITGCTEVCVKKIRALDPRQTVLLNMDSHQGRIEEFCAGFFTQAELANPDGLNIDHRLVDRDLVAAAHRRGLSIWTWTVDDVDRFVELLRFGVDAVSTNWPERMMPLAQRW